MPVYVHILPGKARTEAFPGCCFADRPKIFSDRFQIVLKPMVSEPFVNAFCEVYENVY